MQFAHPEQIIVVMSLYSLNPTDTRQGASPCRIWKRGYRKRWRVALGLSMTMNLACLHAAQSPTRLSVQVLDPSGQLLPCRAWIDAAGERLFRPSTPTSCTPYARDRSFSCDGTFTIDVPGKQAVVHIERGKEYRPVNQPIDLGPSGEKAVSVTVQRWINMPAEGWYSGDLHVHFGADKPKVLRQLALADDVHVTPAFTYWLRGNESKWPSAWPDFGGGEPWIIDATHVITRTGVEIERIRGTAIPGGSAGATFLFNLARPLAAERFGEHFPTDAALCLAARMHSPEMVVDTDKPSWAETVVGAALEVYDTVQVCHNHYHRERTLPGGWGMIGPLAPGESNAAQGDGLFHRTNALYYRFLNCGFRLGVSGGSAIGVMPVPMGYSRVYAKIEGPLTAEKFWSALKAGRSFATNGPMLTMTVDGQPLGSTLKRRSTHPSPVRVDVRVRSIDRLEALELISNGLVIESIDLRNAQPSPTLDRSVTWQVPAKQSGWIAARAIFRAPDGLLRQAHTSPIYISVDDRPIASREDARYMLRWIERLIDIARLPKRFPTEADRQGVLDTYVRARVVYEGIAEETH